MRTDILEREQEIRQWVTEHKTKGFISKELGCRRDTLEAYLKKMSIEYLGNQGGKKTEKRWSRTTAKEYIENSDAPMASRLRKKLIRDGIKEEKCEDCEITEWQGQKLVFELHHVDGNHWNNDLSNLKILCPNCHSLIPNHRK